MNRLNNSLLGLVAISASSAASLTSAAVGVTSPTAVTDSKLSPSIIHRRASHTMTNNTDQVEIQVSETSKKAQEAAHIIKNANVVCFDVDSTVIREEGIDELAKFCGKGAEVARLTREAMKGSMTFQEALRLRLNIIQPSQRQIREFLKAKPSTLSSGIKDFVARLRNNNTKVYLITGGFDCLIEPVALELGIQLDNLYANKLHFTFNGEYAGFDTNQPTSHTGGKGEAVQIIRRQLADNAKIVMIGDGATDLEASPPADHFIGYGGNIVREEVQNRAKYYVTSFDQISSEL